MFHVSWVRVSFGLGLQDHGGSLCGNLSNVLLTLILCILAMKLLDVYIREDLASPEE